MRRDSIFEDVIKMPWPVGVVLAVLVFFMFHTYQLVVPQGNLNQAIFSGIRMVAYFFIAMFLFAAFLSFLTQRIRSKRFRTTKSMSDLRSISWRQFESYIGEMFREQGYFVVETPEGPDNGVDLVLRKDGEKTYVQCKQWKANTVGVEKIRALLGSVTAGGAQAGIFVTSGDYTGPARQFARECGIELVDGDYLADSFKGLDDSKMESTVLEEVITVTCPECNAPMVKRVARRGKYEGGSFWGCSKYPGCRGIRQDPQ